MRYLSRQRVNIAINSLNAIQQYMFWVFIILTMCYNINICEFYSFKNRFSLNSAQIWRICFMDAKSRNTFQVCNSLYIFSVRQNMLIRCEELIKIDLFRCNYIKGSYKYWWVQVWHLSSRNLVLEERLLHISSLRVRRASKWWRMSVRHG